MKTEFLKNFKVNDQELPKEIIDAILAENGRDIEAAKRPFADYDAIKEQLQAAKDGLKAFEGVDVAQLQGKITELQGQLTDKDTEWQGKLAAMAFEGKARDAAREAKARDVDLVLKALDMAALQASKNQDADLKTALESLQKDKGFLFGDDQTPPPYAGGTGAGGNPPGAGTFNFGFTGVRAKPTAT